MPHAELPAADVGVGHLVSTKACGLHVPDGAEAGAARVLVTNADGGGGDAVYALEELFGTVMYVKFSCTYSRQLNLV